MAKKGVLLVNLGSPDSPNPKDVKKYLNEFLMDKHVIDVPYLLRSFLVKGIILNTRPKKSAAAYRKIWWKEGSPLIVLSKRLQEKIQQLISLPVALSMRYGNPSIKAGIKELAAQKVNEILLIPLYPQFAMATTETILVLAEKIRTKKFPEIHFTIIPPFYHHPDYLRTLANSIEEALNGKPWEHILFSYHGIPERHIKKSDNTRSHCKIDNHCCQTPSPAHQYCYRHQCYDTTKRVAEYLALKEGTFSTSFQSRLGRYPWLQPYTDEILGNLAHKGIKNLAVITPAFVSDCLETLEEITIEGKKKFRMAGGEHFYTVPCLNDSPAWVSVLARWIDEWATSAKNTKENV